jgi:anaerobic ribonucleoside-triphosphate reductase activating protein
MRYAQVRKLDISNGEGIGIALFTQGCPYHCEGCFNSETWDFNGGKEYTIEVRDKIVEMCCREGIKRFSILGGEPLLERNREELMTLCSLVKEANQNIKIWLYTGAHYEDIKDNWYDLLYNFIDILVDGPFEFDKRDLTLKFRGSSNQRVIDINKSITEDKIVLYLKDK